jgi:hypothetical protein
MDADPESSTRRESDLALPEGLEAGMMGGLVVVLVYLVPDLLAGDWLRTPARLGALLLYGPDTLGGRDSAGGFAALYTALHFAAWAAAGFTASAGFSLAARRPGLRWLPAVAFGLWIGAMLAADFWIARGPMPSAHLWVGSLAGGLTLAAYLAWRHPAAFPRP